MSISTPKEPRRAPTREEFAALVGTYEAQAYDHGYCEGCASYDDEGLSGAKRTAGRAESRVKATGAALLAAYDAVAAENARLAAYIECPALKAWRALDSEERDYSIRRLAIAGRLGEVAAAALEALGEK